MIFWIMNLKRKLSRYVKIPILSLRAVTWKVVTFCHWEDIVPNK